MSKIIEEQLKKVEVADLSHFDTTTNSYFIPKKNDIRIEENNTYIFQLKPSAFTNNIVNVNWNNSSTPKNVYYKADVIKKMSGMIKIIGIGYDINTGQDTNSFWSGWLSLADIVALQKL